MPAQTATHLPVSPLNRARGAVMHVRASLLILGSAIVAMGIAWLPAREAPPQPVAVISHAEAFAAAAAPVSEPPAVSSGVVTVSAPPQSSAISPQEHRRYRALASFLAKRYRVSQAVTLDLVTMAHAAGHQIGVDPLLIIAMIAVESRFNPIAESVMGAKGLMQIIPKYHSDKFQEFGGVKQVFDPETNILVGSQIIKEYMVRTGNLKPALQLYGGVSTDDNDGYFGKVMTEKQRLQQVLRTKS
jgi:soluble lytic murein transglycosylase-like protein